MRILDRRAWTVRALAGLDDPAAGGARGHEAVRLASRPLASLLAAGTGLWRGLRPPERLLSPPFTVGIGNVRVGGTGKTPVVADLATRWRERGRAVAVASRGYRAGGGGDEPGWLAARGLRLFVGPDRRAAHAQAAAEQVEVLLLDDALQSRVRPAVVLAIVLDRDLRTPPRVLPAGPAREPAPRALARADALLVRVESDPWPIPPPQALAYRQYAADRVGGPAFAFRLVPRDLRDAAGEPVTLARGADPARRCLLVSGLARPESFERDCLRAGLRVVGSVRLADHATPTRQDVAATEGLARRLGADWLICPEKNEARLRAFAWTRPLYALRSGLEWALGDPLDRLDPLVDRA